MQNSYRNQAAHAQLPTGENPTNPSNHYSCVRDICCSTNYRWDPNAGKYIYYTYCWNKRTSDVVYSKGGWF